MSGWDVSALCDMDDSARGMSETHEDLGDDLIRTRNNTSDWEGEAGDAFRNALASTHSKILDTADQSRALSAAIRSAQGPIGSARSEVNDIIDTAASYGWTVKSDWTLDTSASEGDDEDEDDADSKEKARAELQGRLDGVKAQAHQADQDLATGVARAVPLDQSEGHGNHGGVQMVGNGAEDAPPTGAESQADQRKNEADAFRHIFGREPTSTVDWDTAAALDPHSYDPKNGGVPPNIVVARITPTPGQGAVRINLFIPGQSAEIPHSDGLHSNLGDNRGYSPKASPEASRVSILVDHENGIIIARQNPSVDATTGAIKAGHPTVSAIQRSDGGLLLRYNAADPFSPGGEGLAKSIPISVNGELAITPTPHGPAVGGNITNFPATEIYHDSNDGPTQVLAQQWPNEGAAGPLGLCWHRPIGDASLLLGFDDLTPAAAGLPNAGPQHGPMQVPAAPPLVAIPPHEFTDLGSVDAPPFVEHHDPVVTLPLLPPH